MSRDLVVTSATYNLMQLQHQSRLILDDQTTQTKKNPCDHYLDILYDWLPLNSAELLFNENISNFIDCYYKFSIEYTSRNWYL